MKRQSGEDYYWRLFTNTQKDYNYLQAYLQQIQEQLMWKTSELFEHKSWAPETVGK